MCALVTRQEIVKNWLPRYTGLPLDKFGSYILLTNFQRYVDLFAKAHKVPVRGRDKPMPNATSARSRSSTSAWAARTRRRSWTS